jgi:hypothetical protein
VSTFINLTGERRDLNALITARAFGRTTIHISSFAAISATLDRIPARLRPSATIIAADTYDGETVNVGATLGDLVDAADDGAIILFTSAEPLALRIPGMVTTDQAHQPDLVAA